MAELRWALALLSICFFVAACFLPAAYEVRGVSEPGWELLIVGHLGPFAGQFGWYANPLVLWCILAQKPHPLIGFVAIFIASSSFSFNGLFDDTGLRPIRTFGIGFYFWYLCVICAFVKTLIGQRVQRILVKPHP